MIWRVVMDICVVVMEKLTEKILKDNMPKEKAEPIKYKAKCIRMDERTWLLFKDKRKKSGLSWNRYIYKLLTEEKCLKKN
jgi:hypothetical protein